jgi:inhibitor of KinA sporulation pathway (predicted exonuclease)
MEPYDHELLSISIEVPGSLLSTNDQTNKQPDRLRFHTEKLKEKSILDQFQAKLESTSIHTLSKMEQTLSQFVTGNIDKECLINTLHDTFTRNLQKVATNTLGKLNFHPPRSQK